MPVRRRNTIQSIFHGHFDFVSAAKANGGSEDWRRVPIRLGGLSTEEGMPAYRHFELDRMPQFRGFQTSGIGKGARTWSVLACRVPTKPADTIADDPITNCRLLNTNEFRC